MKILLSLVLLLLLSCGVLGQSFSGSYLRSDVNGNGEIKIREIRRGRTKMVGFELFVSGAERGTCIGHVAGTARWISTNVAEFEKKDATGKLTGCRVTLVFSGRNLIIRDKDCDGSHGAACGFAGKYIRNKR